MERDSTRDNFCPAFSALPARRWIDDVGSCQQVIDKNARIRPAISLFLMTHIHKIIQGCIKAAKEAESSRSVQQYDVWGERLQPALRQFE